MVQLGHSPPKRSAWRGHVVRFASDGLVAQRSERGTHNSFRAECRISSALVCCYLPRPGNLRSNPPRRMARSGHKLPSPSGEGCGRSPTSPSLTPCVEVAAPCGRRDLRGRVVKAHQPERRSCDREWAERGVIGQPIYEAVRFRRGEVARILGVSALTIVNREKAGKYPPPKRDVNRYRIYDLSEVFELQRRTFGRIELAPIEVALKEKGFEFDAVAALLRGHGYGRWLTHVDSTGEAANSSPKVLVDARAGPTAQAEAPERNPAASSSQDDPTSLVGSPAVPGKSEASSIPGGSPPLWFEKAKLMPDPGLNDRVRRHKDLLENRDWPSPRHLGPSSVHRHPWAPMPAPDNPVLATLIAEAVVAAPDDPKVVGRIVWLALHAWSAGHCEGFDRAHQEQELLSLLRRRLEDGNLSQVRRQRLPGSQSGLEVDQDLGPVQSDQSCTRTELPRVRAAAIQSSR